MTSKLSKKAILKKTAQFGGVTFLSRIFGIIRDLLKVRLLGVGAISDAFVIAFRVPHFLRKIFAEGSLSAAFIPVFVKKIDKGDLKDANGLMTLSFLFFEGIVLLLTLLVVAFPKLILIIIAPGFSPEQISYSVKFIRILFPIILFISSSALFAGALNSVNHFFIPAFAPVLMNIIFIASILTCLKFGLPVIFLCYGIFFAALVVFVLHFIFYFKYNFSFSRPTKSDYSALKMVLKRFSATLFGVGIVEINLFVDSILSSYLAKGSVSLLYYAGRFVNMPIGILAVGFATVLLPQFSRCANYAPKRLSFYLLQATKFVSWLVIPAMILLIFVSEEIFSIVMLGNKADPHNIWMAKWILITYSCGLLFFCLNKILVNVFYSLHDTKSPTLAIVVSTFANFVLNIIGMKLFGAFGIAGSTALSALVLTLFLFFFLHKKHNFVFYIADYLDFLWRYVSQLLVTGLVFSLSYLSFFSFIKNFDCFNFFQNSWGFWIFIAPLAFACFAFIYFTREKFGINLYYLSK